MVWEELIAYFPWYDTGHIKNDGSNKSSIFACVFVTAVKFLPCRCLATIRGLLEPLPSNDTGNFPEPLPSNDKGIFTEPLPSNDKGILQSRCLATIREL
jgi:hypothetical protein